ncbi:OmpA family protein [Camelimonas lactis]|nr:OmpA family protein [Camelimonas lactis]
MTDMMIGFLFIVILLLAYFSSQYDPAKNVPLPVHERVVSERDASRTRVVELSDIVRMLEARVERLKERINELEAEIAALKVPNPVEVYINNSLAERKRILETLRDQLLIEFPDLSVVLTEESDALRFQGDGLFRSGSFTLRPDRLEFVQAIARRLQALLPCYTLGSQKAWNTGCNSGFALIEAVQIEGHTDSDGPDLANLTLSTSRANETFRIMTEAQPGLITHLNFRQQPVMSVAGYGEMRPIVRNESLESKASNRRIDLRIIMYVPARSEEISVVREALTARR